jgi:cell filamentation protein
MAEDPYVYPRTNTLRNRLGIRETTDLAEHEAALSSIRLAQLERRFIPGDYDLAHLQATHRYIFGDLYSWAGELRTVRIARAETCLPCLSTSVHI